MRSWNTNQGWRDTAKLDPTARKSFNGIMLESRPRKGWTGYWQTLNGRVVLKTKTAHTIWLITLDGKAVGTRERGLREAIRFNEWIFKLGAK